jgi:hypothetical protein
VESLDYRELLETAQVRVPVASREASNVTALYATASALGWLRTNHLGVVALLTTVAGKERMVAESGRGRRPGSTNWSRERFWRRYASAVRLLKRPYRRTHLAAHIGLSYGTFMHYLALWGPPCGIARPGD